MAYITRKEAEALNLLELVKHHKEHCDSECNVCLSLVRPLYERLVERSCTDEESHYFV